MATFSEGVSVKLDPQAVAFVLRGPQGPVVRSLFKEAEYVKKDAKRRVGVGTVPPAGPRRTRRPGTLRDSIVKRIANRGGEISVEVGSDDEIALWHHEGTRPHQITPRRAPRLVFYWAKVGSVVSFPRVSHPGTQPNRFLTDAVRALRGRY